MKILIVSATIIEVKTIISYLQADIFDAHNARYCDNNHTIDFLITGCGSVSTTYQTLKKLAADKYDLAVNLGIAGAYNERVKPGQVCEIVEEQFGDIGVNRESGFLTLFEAGLQHPDKKPFKNGKLFNNNQPPFKMPENIKKVQGFTVNTPSADYRKASTMAEKYNVDVETMESAAFFYVCLMENIPFLSLRSISNKVGDKKSLWNIPLAVKNLSDTFIKIIKL